MGSLGIPSDPANTWRLRAGTGYRHFRESANRQSGVVNTTASGRSNRNCQCPQSSIHPSELASAATRRHRFFFTLMYVSFW
jgi:hypothetical protein